ncbi:hypothetical protein AVEN_269568-1 [Araneus ventricosus]|uniref:Uncharacterized protein n=1 Tax=Araneus ventricosus TaxID=182803 RepID=A0A4Y2CDB1_ARAVE|nr:hypothetical protein AVEN_269568-1 [Araneus ventricosus]
MDKVYKVVNIFHAATRWQRRRAGDVTKLHRTCEVPETTSLRISKYREALLNFDAQSYCNTLQNHPRAIKNKWSINGQLRFCFRITQSCTMPKQQRTLRSFRCEVLDYPTYSLVLSPCDFHAFGQLMMVLKGYTSPAITRSVMLGRVVPSSVFLLLHRRWRKNLFHIVKLA